MTWTTIRTLDAQAAEATTAPSASSIVDLGQYGPRVEVRLVGGEVTGDPTTVHLHVWRSSGGTVDLLGRIDIAAADVGTSTPASYALHERNCYVSVSFTGGTDPRLSGTIEARVVYGYVAVESGGEPGPSAPAVQFDKIEIDTSEHDGPTAIVPVTSIPAGSIILSARLSHNIQRPPLGMGVQYMLVVGGEDALVYASYPEQENAIKMGGPAQVPAPEAGGLHAVVMIVPLDLPDPWEPATPYEEGDRIVQEDGSVYVCTQAGTSAGPPTGEGSGIEDGTVIWDYVTIGEWQPATAYEAGDLVQWGNYYRCIESGTSGTDGPQADPDGSARWEVVVVWSWGAGVEMPLGRLIVDDDNHFYEAVSEGVTASGPTGEGSAIVDGTVEWDYVETIPTPSLADWGATVTYEVAWVPPA